VGQPHQKAARIADYYVAAGVLSHGAHFVSIDKYGLDGGFGGAAPWNSTWFWNAIGIRRPDQHRPALRGPHLGFAHGPGARRRGGRGVFGDGVGESTRGRGLPPPDEGWFIGKVQSYLASPVRR
jgi:hypothetical protein